MDLPSGRAQGSVRAALGRVRSSRLAAGGVVNAGVAAFPALAGNAGYGAAGSRVSRERYGEFGDFAPVAVDERATRVQAGTGTGGAIPVLGGAEEVPEAALYGTGEDARRDGGGSGDLCEGARGIS